MTYARLISETRIDALVAAARTEEKMVISLAGIPYSLTETDFRNIVNEIRTQEAST